MKKQSLLIMGLVSLMATAQQQTESFDFSGSVSGNNGWTKSTGTAGEIKTTDGSLTYSTITSVGNKLSIVNGSPYEAIYLPLSQPITTTFYMSFLINVADLATVQTSTTGVGGFFMTLSTSSTLESSNRVYIKGGSEPNTYILGFGNNTGPANTGLEDIYGKSPKNLELNTTYFVVVKYDMTDTGVKSSLWINPTSSSESSPEFTNTKGTKVAQISSLFVRDANFVPNMSIDEIRIDTTWENVVNVPLATNETTGTKKAIISNTFVTDSFKLLTENKAKVEIYSATGTLVKQGEFASEAEINVAHLSSGLYIVKINEGGNTYTTKIIKK